MASLSVRRLDDKIYDRLQKQAKKHGVSTEEEVRRIIGQAVSAPEKISAVFKRHFGEKNGVELKLTKRRKFHEPMEFDE